MIGHIIYSYLKKFEEYEVSALAGSRKYDEFTTVLDVRNINLIELYIKNISELEEYLGFSVSNLAGEKIWKTIN